MAAEAELSWESAGIVIDSTRVVAHPVSLKKTPIAILGPSSLPVVVDQPYKRHRSVLE